MVAYLVKITPTHSAFLIVFNSLFMHMYLHTSQYLTKWLHGLSSSILNHTFSLVLLERGISLSWRISGHLARFGLNSNKSFPSLITGWNNQQLWLITLGRNKCFRFIIGIECDHWIFVMPLASRLTWYVFKQMARLISLRQKSVDFMVKRGVSHIVVLALL